MYFYPKGFGVVKKYLRLFHPELTVFLEEGESQEGVSFRFCLFERSVSRSAFNQESL